MSDIEARPVTFPSSDPKGKPLNGYLARPAGTGPFPGVIVLHEIFGLNNNIRNITHRFARAGYTALAVDLYSHGSNRPLCIARTVIGMFTNSLNSTAIHDLKAALSYLQNQPGVDSEKLGVIGFCMGGTFSLAFACTDQRLKAASVFYGQNPRPLEAVARACPIVGNYPEKDWTAPMGRKLDQALDQYGIPHDIKEYPGARHSFFNDTGFSYDRAAAEDAWQRTLAFFEQYME